MIRVKDWIRSEKKNRIILIFIGIYTMLFLALFFLHPVTDSDVVDSYLPLARTIIIKDSLPTHNYFDDRPFIIPPVGGPLFFAYYYAVSGQLTSEVFRLINLPFFLGFIIISYFIFYQFLSKKSVLIGILSLMTIPLIEDMVFSASLYPDFIFSFLTIFCLWIITKITQSENKKNPRFLYFTLGLALALSLLFKYQALFTYSLVFSIGIVSHFSGIIKSILVLAGLFSPFILKYIPHGPYGSVNGLYLLIFILLMLYAAFLLINEKTKDKNSKGKLIYAFFISFFGFIFIFRNYFIFKNIVEKATSYNWATSVEEVAGKIKDGGNIIETIAFFVSPVLAWYWLIPKIIGIRKIINKKQTRLPLIITIVLYCEWVIFLGAADTKWLFPILPYMIIIIIKGLETILKDRNKIQKIIIASVVFALFSSKFIFWNLWVVFFGNISLRTSTAKPKTTSFVLEKLSSIPQEIKSMVDFILQIINSVTSTLVKILHIMTSRTGMSTVDVPLVIIISVIVFVIMIFLTKNHKKYRLNVIIPALMIFIYSGVFIGISEGNPLNFTQNEEKKIFDYWGQTTVVLPYLKKNIKQDDVLLVYSSPTGLSYHTVLKTYNLEQGGGLLVLYPLFKEENLNIIYNYYKQKKIRFIIVRDYGESILHFNNLRKMTKIFDILDDNRYAEMVIKPENGSFWKVYEIKQIY